MKTQNHFRFFFGVLIFSILISYQTGKSQELNDALVDSIKTKMKAFISNDMTNKGLLFSILNEKTNDIHIFTEGAIESKNDLKVACPIIKPCLSYMI